eukprot:3877183-Rhodomonas_salina.2
MQTHRGQRLGGACAGQLLARRGSPRPVSAPCACQRRALDDRDRASEARALSHRRQMHGHGHNMYHDRQRHSTCMDTDTAHAKRLMGWGLVARAAEELFPGRRQGHQQRALQSETEHHPRERARERVRLW